MGQDEQHSDTEHPEAVPAGPAPNADGHDQRADSADRDDRPEFHRPGPVPSALGAPSVGGAVAASALAGDGPVDEPDARAESTARPGDGAVGAVREGWRADPTAEFRGGPGWVKRRAERATAVAEAATAEGQLERRRDGAAQDDGRGPDAG